MQRSAGTVGMGCDPPRRHGASIQLQMWVTICALKRAGVFIIFSQMQFPVLPLAAAFCLGAASLLRADDYSQLQDWFSKPEDTRGGVPASVTNTLINAADVKAAADKVWQAYKTGAIAL